MLYGASFVLHIYRYSNREIKGRELTSLAIANLIMFFILYQAGLFRG